MFLFKIIFSDYLSMQFELMRTNEHWHIKQNPKIDWDLRKAYTATSEMRSDELTLVELHMKLINR